MTEFPDGRFFLVQLDGGGFLALYRRCTHLGCAVAWQAADARFSCPCHGSHFDQAGTVENPPAPRALDTFLVTISDGAVLVLIIALALYSAREETRLAEAQTTLREQAVGDAAAIYVENCAVCHGAEGEGLGATPPLANEGLRTIDYDTLFKVIARGRYETPMAAWHQDEGGILNDYQIDQIAESSRPSQFGWGRDGIHGDDAFRHTPAQSVSVVDHQTQTIRAG